MEDIDVFIKKCKEEREIKDYIENNVYPESLKPKYLKPIYFPDLPPSKVIELKESFDAYIDTHNLGNYIEFVGTINSEQKEGFFTKLDAFVMPCIALKNDQDGIPVVIMEALDYSLPIVSTEVSGVPEICKNDYNGKLIPERDAISLADSIEFLCVNKDVTKSFGTNSKVMSAEYDIEINSEKKLKMICWV